MQRLGVIVHSLGEIGSGRTLRGAAEAAARRGYVLDVIATDVGNESSVRTALALASERQIAGLIATAQTRVVSDLVTSVSLPVPFVGEVRNRPAGFDMTHDEAIGALAFDHLYALGHRKIGYVSGPTSWASASGRLHGFRERMQGTDAVLVWCGAGDWSASSGYKAAVKQLGKGLNVSAIATGNDSMAIGLIAALKDAGLDVPKDISVIGTDDILDAQFHRPAISTIAIDFEGEGNRLVEEVLVAAGVIQEHDIEGTVQPPHLVARASTTTLAGA